ncbi:6586_t:CDS:1 [Ambispora gerdemannii]|uniref:6586_t:CDS:1 n=1 Tax=Ambispora gerdemannii TaxID=144530 RepID=A0A9N9AAZ6_9GLOM|nr:6586_t:CDS:1 [Ambispora gerdemannii]
MSSSAQLPDTNNSTVHLSRPTPQTRTLTKTIQPQILIWKFPSRTLLQTPFSPTLTLIGMSRAADETAFYIPELGFMFDCGLKVHTAVPTHIFITHTHSDHCLMLTQHVSKHHPPNIYLPNECVELVERYLNASQELTDYGEEYNARIRFYCAGVEKGDVLTIGGDQKEKTHVGGYEIHVINMDHSVPCVGYMIYSKRKRLKPEYKDLTGQEIAALKKSDKSLNVMQDFLFPLFTFCGDTTAKIFKLPNPNNIDIENSNVLNDTDRSQNHQWNNMPFVITECTFLKDEHIENAERTKHTRWQELQNVVKLYPATVFILIHFSKRYSDDYIQRFFEQEKVEWKERGDGNLENIVVWI